MRIFFVATLIALLAVPFAAAYEYRIGTGKADITGPAAGVQMWGFVRDGQVTEGIHIRLWARAFVIAEADSDDRVAFVVADLGSIPHDMQVAVLQKLSEEFGGTYTRANTILSATHTHAGPGGYWPAVEGAPLAGSFYLQHFEAIVAGITAAISQAHESLAPGDIYINKGSVEGAGAQRSATAYLNNPEEERARYKGDTDKEMTLLKFVTDEGVIGVLNWFAVHPTSMTYNNKLISGDHKGHAEQLLEAASAGDDYAEDFIAAFANSNCGDVTPNLNLDNTGPGEDEFESTRIIAERQYAVAAELAQSASEKVIGPINSVQSYVDFSDLEVADEYTGQGVQHTCPSAYGYAFAAGSTEDGGGHPLFKEGMTERDPLVDAAVKQQFNMPDPSEAVRACQLPKAILFAPGDMDPPAQPQIIPLGLAQIGQLMLVAVPGEITTMSGRRLRETVREASEGAEEVVIAAYSNHYSGYVTTYEEYQTQQYEGGHTLFGPWMLAGMQQEYARLARALGAGEAAASDDAPGNNLEGSSSRELSDDFDATPEGAEFGDVLRDAATSYARGEVAEAVFWSANPNHNFHTGQPYLEVQRKSNEGWETVATDDDWATRFTWRAHPEVENASQAEVRWAIPEGTPAGTYRLVHRGQAVLSDEERRDFEGASKPFEVE